MKPDFIARRALLILCVIFFLVPFGLRGARMSLQRMENNVKDWLPDSFEETRELEWFARHFVGEQSFVLLTWEGCSAEDESFKLLVEKLRHEVQPEKEEEISDAALNSAPSESENMSPEELLAYERQLEAVRARQWGDRLGLYTPENYHFNWGGLDEKWLKGGDESWYYITPNGDLYRWQGRSNVLGALGRLIKRNILGDKSLQGSFVAKFGRAPSVKNTNAFHDDPRKLTARVLKSVTTGPGVLAELSAPGGSMWPLGTQYSDEERERISRRRSLDRLKGTLFGPEPYEAFSWTAEDLPHVLPPDKQRELPAGWQQHVETFIATLVAEEYDGELTRLQTASLLDQEEHWNAMFAQLGVSPPGLQTCIMVTLSHQGTEDLRRVIGRGLLGKPRGKLVQLAAESGVRPPNKPPMNPLVSHELAGGKVLRMGGPPVDNVAIDEEGQITLVRLIGFSVVLGLGLGYLCFHRVSVTLMIFLVGGISAVTSLGIVWWSGSSVDAILMSMPSLVYVLGLSGAVHIVNYYREAAREHGLVGAPRRALAYGLAPCTLAAFTTALGLLSLYNSDIYPIRKFGLFSAVGVMATLILLFTFLPAALQLWPPGYHLPRSQDSASGFRRKIHDAWQAVGNWVVGHHWWVSGTTLVMLVAVGVGLTKLNTSIQLLKLFDADSKIINDYAWLETNIGKIVPMELIVGVEKGLQYPTLAQRDSLPPPTAEELANEKYQYNFLERIELVAHIQDAVERVFGEGGQNVVGRALSAATFTPPILDPLDTQRFPTNKRLEENRDRLLKENYLAIDKDGTELWRISVRLGALNDVDYGQFVTELKRVVEPVVGAYELRDVILRSIAEQRADKTSSSSSPENVWHNARVAILGLADPRGGTDQRDEEQVVESADAALSGRDIARQSDEDLRVDEVFARVLGDLLRAKKFEGPRRGGRSPRQLLTWHDPVAKPLGDKATSQEWGQRLGSYDCVVVLKDHPDYDMDFIRRHAKQVVDAREHAFDPASDLTAKQRDEPIEVTYTGVVPIVYKAQRTLLHSLINSIGWAFVMIAAVMIVLLRTRKWWPFNVRGGLVSMVPNVLPVVLIFGAMGHLGVLVDIGTMMTASVAMGVAVDDTIHFLTWFRRGIREGMERGAAIQHAYSHVAVAMTQTTLIGGLGLSVFALSTFTPTQRFGTMMLTLLVAALYGDLILLPALLAGPLGKYLCPKTTGTAAAHSERAAVEDAVDTVQGSDPPATGSSEPTGGARGPMHGRAREGRPSIKRRDAPH